jgi:flagellar motor switch protein FliN/FliY
MSETPNDAKDAAEKEPVGVADAPEPAGAGVPDPTADVAAPEVGLLDEPAQPDEQLQPDVSAIEFAQLEPDGNSGAVGNLELLRDIELSVTVEVGRARLRVRELLALHEGSIVELDRPVGSPVDLLANGRTIARGEIVLVDDQLGLRVTSFTSDDDGV